MDYKETELFPGKTKIDLTGQNFHGMTAIRFVGMNKWHNAYWEFQCHCGKLFISYATHIKNGKVRSCGCQRVSHYDTHGITSAIDTPEEWSIYTMWQNARQHCTNPNSPEYENYGARGIRMCTKWDLDYHAFRNYVRDNLGPRPNPQHSMDRINNNGDYEPGNIHWATQSEQMLNQRRSRKVQAQTGP